ncbi:prepilin-type N-terminal cleavage/methylation domain-containing protein [Thermodesulfobacteriota bacterium]
MKGFTLLEILVSLALLSIIMAAVYGAYTSSVSNIQQARYESEAWQTARIAIDRMGKDLESSFMGTQGNMVSKGMEIKGRPADSISFTTLTHLVLNETDPQTDLCQVDYYVAEAEGNNYLTLFRSEKVIVAQGVSLDARVQEMAGMVTGLEIDFQDNKGASFTERTTREDLPSLIRIRLRLEDRLGREHEFMTSIHPGATGF